MLKEKGLLIYRAIGDRGLWTQNIGRKCLPQAFLARTRSSWFSFSSLSLSHPSAMALSAAISYPPLSLCLSLRPLTTNRRFSPLLASVSSSSHESSSPPSSPAETILSSNSNPPAKPLVESSRPVGSRFNYALPDSNANLVVRFVRSSESSIERVISNIFPFSSFFCGFGFFLRCVYGMMII